MDYRIVPRPRPKCWQRKYAWLYPILDRVGQGQAVALPINGEPVRRMRDTIRRSLWRAHGLRIRSTAHNGKLFVWPMETDLETGLPPEEGRGKHWEVINEKAPTRPRQPAPARY